MSKRHLIKNKCEIAECNVTDPKALELHHIIERTKENTSNHRDNLAILCSLHHTYVHIGRLRLIGIFPSTQLPNCRTLVYELDGKKNLDIDTEYLPFKNKAIKL